MKSLSIGLIATSILILVVVNKAVVDGDVNRHYSQEYIVRISGEDSGINGTFPMRGEPNSIALRQEEFSSSQKIEGPTLVLYLQESTRGFVLDVQEDDQILKFWAHELGGPWIQQGSNHPVTVVVNKIE